MDFSIGDESIVMVELHNILAPLDFDWQLVSVFKLAPLSHRIAVVAEVGRSHPNQIAVEPAFIRETLLLVFCVQDEADRNGKVVAEYFEEVYDKLSVDSGVDDFGVSQTRPVVPLLSQNVLHVVLMAVVREKAVILGQLLGLGLLDQQPVLGLHEPVIQDQPVKFGFGRLGVDECHLRHLVLVAVEFENEFYCEALLGEPVQDFVVDELQRVVGVLLADQLLHVFQFEVAHVFVIQLLHDLLREPLGRIVKDQTYLVLCNNLDYLVENCVL